MLKQKMLPVGTDSFEKIRKSDFYYIDKTILIEQILQTGSEVNLFTRPRRFGKTLNMSMLKSFFEIGTDAALFDGLSIFSQKDLCDHYLGKFPVIFLSLKGVDGLSFASAKYRLTELIGVEAERFAFLSESSQLTSNERDKYCAITNLIHGKYSMNEDLLVSSLQTLSQLLYHHYGQKVILLIDEYDVPLDKAFQHGYYKEMISLIRGLFGQALKTNPFLQFAVLTGCLRISKESIFTGLNNFKVYSIDDVRYSETFGFTANEVKQLLTIACGEIDDSIDNLWSVLFTTGYLTKAGCAKGCTDSPETDFGEDGEDDTYRLTIPNKEIRKVFIFQIRNWFDQVIASSRSTTSQINNGFLEGRPEDIQQALTMLLGETIRILDTKARNEEKEIFYHGILLGVLKSFPDWAVKSNRETGDGFADILIKPKNPDAGILIELKYAHTISELDRACEKALEQIKDRRYSEALLEDGRTDILAYGIAFCKKRCNVVMEKL